jgi:hypothetical protein
MAFKAAVILPLIQAIRSYWKLRSDLPVLRMDAWPRIVHKGHKVAIKWALSEPPAGYVFDVYIQEPEDSEPNIDQEGAVEDPADGDPLNEQLATITLIGEGRRIWFKQATNTSAQYTCPRAGTYRFQARWRKAAESRADASKTPQNVKVIAKE